MVNEELIKKSNDKQTYLSGSLKYKKIYGIVIFIISIVIFALSFIDIFELHAFNGGKFKMSIAIAIKLGVLSIITLFIKDMYFQAFSSSNKIKKHWIWIIIYTIILAALLAFQIIATVTDTRKVLLIGGLLILFRYSITFLFDVFLYVSEKYARPFLHRALKWKAVMYIWLLIAFLSFFYWWETRGIPFGFIESWLRSTMGNVYLWIFISLIIAMIIFIIFIIPLYKWLSYLRKDKRSSQTKYIVAKSIGLVAGTLLSIIYLIHNKDYRFKWHDWVIMGMLLINFIVYILFLVMSKFETKAPIVKVIHLSLFLFSGIMCLVSASDGLLWQYNQSLVLFTYVLLSIIAIAIWQIKEPVVTGGVIKLMSLVTFLITGTMIELIIFDSMGLNRITKNFSIFQLNMYVFMFTSGFILLVSTIKLWTITKRINKDRNNAIKLRKGYYEAK